MNLRDARIRWPKVTLTESQAKDILAVCEQHRMSNTRCGFTKVDAVALAFNCDVKTALEFINQAERLIGDATHESE